MYFTIDEREPSSATQDTRRSFNTIRTHAAVLADLSASFREQATEVTAAYRQAAWARFIYASSDIAAHGQTVEELLGLQERERAAWRLFRQIAEENADLLILQPVLATA
jgi:hypothetical protein